MPEIDAHWLWLIFGLVLAAAEIIAPGAFMLWVGGAAVATGVLTLVSGVAVPVQLLMFAVLAVAAVYAARTWQRESPAPSADPLLNDRAARLIGRVVTVVEAVDEGGGRVRVDDGVWPARGPDAAAGARVRILAVEDGCLAVAPVEAKALASEA